MARNGDDYKAIAYLIIIGGGAFINGFRKLRLRRQAMVLATSRARSMAMGTVELSGIASKYADISDPIFKMPCVYYNIHVEQHQGSGKNSRWVTIFRDLCPQPFFCKDATGRILILPKNPSLHFPNPIVLRNGLLSAFSSNRPLFTTKESPKTSDVTGVAYLSRWSGDIRVTAHILREGDPLYVIGCALPTREMMAAVKPAVADVPGDISLAAQLKKDAARMKELDANKDGQIDAMEWEQGLASYKRFLEMKRAHELELAQEKTKKEAETRDPLEFSGLVTGTSDVEMIMAPSEDEFVQKLGTGAFLGVIGGGAALILGLILLLLKFN